jgi:hypothetical protein
MDNDHRRPGHRPPVLDMTPEGEFRDPSPPPFRRTWLDRALGRIGGVALLLTLAAGGLVVVTLAVLLLGLLLPVAIGAGLVAFASLWWRARRLRGRGGPGGGGGPGSGGGFHFVVIRR